MPLPWLIALAGLALLGHGSCWLAIANRLEASGWRRKVEKPIVRTLHLLMLAIIGLASYDLIKGHLITPAGEVPRFSMKTWAWLWGCAAVAVGPVAVWIVARLLARPPALLQSNHTTVHHPTPGPVSGVAGGFASRCLLSLPGNECLRIDVHEKTLAVPQLPPELSGLSIAHLSDLHMSGKIGRVWFETAIGLVNDMQADLVAITGDLVENPACRDWIPHTLGQLRSRHGTFFVLGNHDLRADAAEVRRLVAAAGLIDLGGRTARVEVRGGSVFLAGNERPWIRPLPDESSLESNSSPELRVLLAHTPDQLGWARRYNFDLMLAGHTHGGQIRLPGLGAIVAPSLSGGKYAAGVFHQPPTIMHVSRGLSGLHLLRWNCPPELTRLVLVRG
ncbi:MAG: metallophosphoesterase [Pirellulales bacterium]